MATFGYTTIGASTATNFAADFVACGGLFTLGENGTVTSISMYTVTGGLPIVLGIWADNAGSPGALICQSSTGTTAANDWTTLSVANVSISAGDYWIGWNHDTSGLRYRYDALDGELRKFKANTYTGTLPNPFPSSPNTTNAIHQSIYATYTPAVSSTEFDAQPGSLTITGFPAGFPAPAVFLVAGQSNSEGHGTNLSDAPTHPGPAAATVFRQDNAWKAGVDPFDSTSSGGSCWPFVADEILHETDESVEFITTGVNGASLSTNWASGGSAYTAALTTLDNSGASNVTAVLWHGCESDVSSQSRSQIKAGLGDLIGRLRADRPALANAVMVVNCLGQFSSANQTNLDNVRLGIMDAWDDNTGNFAYIYPGAMLFDVDLSDESGDSLHFKSLADRRTQGRRMWLGVQAALYSGTNGRGPRLTSATQFISTPTQIVLTFDKTLRADITSYTTSAFVVLDDATPVTVSAAAKTGTNEVTLTLASAITGTATVSFGSGETAVGATIPMGTQITLGSGATVYQPAELFIAEEVAVLSEIDAQPGTLTITGSPAGFTLPSSGGAFLVIPVNMYVSSIRIF